jgi:hypothetical protein
VGMGCPYSSSEQWKPLAQEVLSDNRDLTANSIPETPVKGEIKVKELAWERRRKLRRLGRFQPTP